jgi:hypothetical protein
MNGTVELLADLDRTMAKERDFGVIAVLTPFAVKQERNRGVLQRQS